MSGPLSDEQIKGALAELQGWAVAGGRLAKTFTFGGFPEAISFIVRLAFCAEQMDHHPELRNVYNRVEVALCTHDAGNRVTGKDVELARRIEAFCWV